MIIYFIIGALIVALDQASKICITRNFELGQQRILLDKILSFVYVQNKGAAFGIMQGGRIFFIAVTAVVFIAAAIYLWKNKPQNILEKLAFSFIGGGALGNLIDRIYLGYVRDFISADFIDFPVFNVADCFVCVGAALYLVYIIFFCKE